jgi:hypothetical protein
MRLGAVLGLGAPVIGGAVVSVLRQALRARERRLAQPGEALSLVQLTRRTIAALRADPLEVWTRVATEIGEWPERRRPVLPYIATPDWAARLDICLGLTAPSTFAADAPPIWNDILARMAGQGITAGPMSYLGNNDGDLGLTRAIWRLVRGLNATRVVETGVAHAVTSRFILEALARNEGLGHLWSIDLPPMLHPELHKEIGVAVDYIMRRNWTYVEGSSRRRLKGMLRQAAPIDLFIHDSRHTTGNVLYELKHAWRALRPGGAAVVDDVDTNNGFHRFCETVDHDRAWVCEAEPVRPDERRANRRGYFGIIMKPG